jgi:two-component system cell cycle sensor histidine kinase/response regulator CckA
MVTQKEQFDILLVEDDEDDYFITQALLSKTTGFEPRLHWARTYQQGLGALTSEEYDVCLVDYRLGADDGLQLLREANALGCRTPMILLTGQGDLEVDLKAMLAGASDYLVKGQIDAQLLERSIRYARERKRAEERIREQAALLDEARDAISAYDLEGRVIYWNKGAERLTGWLADEMIGREADALLYDEGHDKLAGARREVLETGEWSGELLQRTKEGKELVVESRWTLVRDGAANPRSILVINTDVTERKRLESQFLRVQRMESIGRLVSGIAHDLGNLLVPILLGVKVLQQRYGDNEQAMRTLSMIHKSAQRGSDMVKQVLAFARGVEGERVALRPEQVVREVVKITEEAFPASVEVSHDVSEPLRTVMGDATQLQQVLMNLCVNARDAMPEGGRLTIVADNADIDEHYTRTNLEAQPGSYVRITVTDTGSGIPQDILDQVFEPFFTTKPSGKGTGLGLSTVYSIVKSHGGFINVQSDVGVGTTFAIHLPASAHEQAGEPDDEEGAPAAMDSGNGELILIVDDEDSILETAQAALESSGYRVLTARDSLEALSLLKHHQQEIDAVVTDIMMPEMDGLATIRALRKIREDLPVIAASGMGSDLSEDALAAGAHLFLSKPFTAEKLCAALQELLRRDGLYDKAT